MIIICEQLLLQVAIPNTNDLYPMIWFQITILIS